MLILLTVTSFIKSPFTSLWCTYLSLFLHKENTDKCQCFAIKVLVLQRYQPATAKSTKCIVVKEPKDINRMLINSRCYPLWQKASRAPAKPFSLQLLLSSSAICECSPSKADPHGTSESPLTLTLICFHVFGPADSSFFSFGCGSKSQTAHVHRIHNSFLYP